MVHTIQIKSDISTQGLRSSGPVEAEASLSVAGKATVNDLEVNGVFSFRSGTFTENTRFNKSVLMSDTLSVVGKATVNDIQSTGVFNFKSGTFTEDTRFNKNVTVDGVLKANEIEVENMRYTNVTFDKETFFSEPINAHTIRTRHLDVTDGFTTDNDIYTSAEISGRSGYFYNLTSIGKTELKDDVLVTGELEVEKGTRLKGDLIVTGNVINQKNASVMNMYASKEISASTLKTSSNIDVTGDALFRKDMNVARMGTFSDIVVNGKATIGEVDCDTVSSNTFSVETLIVRDIMQISDARLKTNVHALSPDDVMDKIRRLRPVSFEWRDSGMSDVGFIAQEVKDVFPECVSDAHDRDIMGVKYSNMVSLLVSCIQNLQEQIDELKRN